MASRGRYMLRRLGSNLVTFWIVVTVVFVLFRLLPGDPVAVIVDPLAGPDARAAVVHDLGLDRSLPVQYGLYLRNLVRGNLGASFVYRQPVLKLVVPTFVNTFVLAFLAFLISYSLGILLGVLLAWKRNSALESPLTFAVIFLRSAPPFWLGTIAVMLIAVRWGVLPVAGMHDAGAAPPGLFAHFFTLDFLRHAILPVGVGSVYFLGLPALLMRGSMLEVISEEYVELARAKGLSTSAVLFRHAARNALLPVLTAGTMFLGWAMGGLVAIEYLFSWPGLGQQMVQSLSQRDYPLAQGAFILAAVLIMVLNFLTDLLTGYLNPKIQMQ